MMLYTKFRHCSFNTNVDFALFFILGNAKVWPPAEIHQAEA